MNPLFRRICGTASRKREIQGIESHDLNDKKGVASQRTIRGIKIHNSKIKAMWPARMRQTGESRPLAREAWRHCWPVINNSRDKNPQLKCQDDINQSKKILSGSHAENPTRKALEKLKLKFRVKNKTAQKAILASK
jgi:hypothetical protein